MKKIISILSLLFVLFTLSAQKPEDTEDWSRRPVIVTPGKNSMPPSDAIILYRGKEDIINWTDEQGNPSKWLSDDSLTVVPGTGSIYTKMLFGDVQLHVEWRTPSVVSDTGQGRGNSGVFMMGLYEIQVLDSYKNETYYNGQAGSIYKQYIPLVNACTPPGTWQSYDIFFNAPVFNEDQTLKIPAYITVVQNGILVQNHVEIKGPMTFEGMPAYKYHKSKLPLMLQEHKNPVSYRNIWIREL